MSKGLFIQVIIYDNIMLTDSQGNRYLSVEFLIHHRRDHIFNIEMINISESQWKLLYNACKARTDYTIVSTYSGRINVIHSANSNIIFEYTTAGEDTTRQHVTCAEFLPVISAIIKKFK